ncbi:MAG TPA: imidazole glycerol phosphate synthase subunit HisH [Clostridia bacterium]|nr:imidazole glycerol phosphate synthase subunit HisH [Clostridia bacterium]
MIAIIDYSTGNLQSVKNALNHIGAPSEISTDKDFIRSASGIILPGVGSFGDAMLSMQKNGLTEVVKQVAIEGKPFLGICLGLQLLYGFSEESPGVEGLGLLKGEIKKVPSNGVKVPHMGWNSIDIQNPDGIFKGIEQESYVYYVHSYYLEAQAFENVSATTQYGVPITAAISRGNLFACQFHPEKSGNVGLEILRNFANICVEEKNVR